MFFVALGRLTAAARRHTGPTLEGLGGRDGCRITIPIQTYDEHNEENDGKQNNTNNRQADFDNTLQNSRVLYGCSRASYPLAVSLRLWGSTLSPYLPSESKEGIWPLQISPTYLKHCNLNEIWLISHYLFTYWLSQLKTPREWRLKLEPSFCNRCKQLTGFCSDPY